MDSPSTRTVFMEGSDEGDGADDAENDENGQPMRASVSRSGGQWPPLSKFNSRISDFAEINRKVGSD